MAKKLKTNYRAGEKILATITNATNEIVNQHSDSIELLKEKGDSIQETLSEASLHGGTVQNAKSVTLAPIEGLGSANVQEAVKELSNGKASKEELNTLGEQVSDMSQRTLVVAVVSKNGGNYLSISIGQSSDDNTKAILGSAICGYAICGKS